MGAYDDLMNASALGGIAEGFVRGLNQGRETRLREIEMDAKLKSNADDRKRQAYMDAMETRAKGFKLPENGSLYDTPGSALEYDPAYIEMQREKAAANDPFGIKGMQAQNAGLEQVSKKLEIQKKQKEASQEALGFKLPPDKVLQVQQGAQIPRMLEDIGSTLDQNAGLFGPVQGRLGSANPYDEKSQTVDAQLRTASQAIGRYMEGGVLRKEDEEKYRKMLPTLSDSPQVAKNKLALVNKMLAEKHNADIGALRAQGYDVSGFSQLPVGQLPGALGGKKKGLMKQGLVGGQKGLVSAPAAPQMSADDMQALEWANANPKDPRAAEIKKRLGQ